LGICLQEYFYVKDIDEAIAITRENPEFKFEKTARIEVRPIKMIERTTNYEYPNR